MGPAFGIRSIQANPLPVRSMLGLRTMWVQHPPSGDGEGKWQLFMRREDALDAILSPT